MNDLPGRERTPGIKLLFAAIVAAVLTVPLLLVYALVYDRQDQSRIAQTAINAGWGGAQVVTGPVIAIPFIEDRVENEVVGGQTVTRTVQTRSEIFLSPQSQTVTTDMAPEKRRKSIYESVIYKAALGGEARFELPADLARFGVARERLLLDQAELRFGISDPRGLQSDAKVIANGGALPLQPGKGVAASAGAGFFAFLSWDGAAPLTVQWSYGLRGSHSLALVPRGGNTEWKVKSPWPHPSFAGSFLPEAKRVSNDGFTATYSVPNLALGQALVLTADPGPPMIQRDGMMAEPMMPTMTDRTGAPNVGGPSMAASIGLIEPVDLYSKVNRAVKYGFLFIGFTFLAFFLFDVVGGARVAAAEFLLTGAGLVLFFVLVLAFAEVIGFTPAYVLASAAIIGLLTAYSAAVLGSWRRARLIGVLLVGLYALLFVLLNLEAWSLLIGSVLLFVALAGVMYLTRGVDWSAVGRRDPNAAA
jgi:inner membrane protein